MKNLQQYDSDMNLKESDYILNYKLDKNYFTSISILLCFIFM